MISEKNFVQCLLVEATKPTIEFFPAWQTSMPTTITLEVRMNSGSFTLIDSPPIFELICFMMFEATDMFILSAVRLRKH